MSKLPDAQILKEVISRAVATRRDLHQHAEMGLAEFRTASKVMERLEALGLEVLIGSQVMDASQIVGLPPELDMQAYRDRALQQGITEELLQRMDGGLTGVVGVLDTGKPGPVLALRVDMDALPIFESDSGAHQPAQDGFRSVHDGIMHACGHDVHTAIGLAVAEFLSKARGQLRGKIKFLFQPAEEGGRGGLPMAASGIVDDVDYLIAIHVGTGVPSGVIRPAVYGHLASLKWDVRLAGLAAHAGGRPEEGRNVLLAAAHAVVGLYSIARHHAGRSRVNVGVLKAGSGRNVIADSATLIMELRGETDDILDYMEKRAFEVLKGAAAMQDVSCDIEVVGRSITADSDANLAARIAASGQGVESVRIDTQPYETGGSEDATYLMRRVQERGGQAVYCAIGSDLPTGHHTRTFDIQESDMGPAIEVLARSLVDLGEAPKINGQ